MFRVPQCRLFGMALRTAAAVFVGVATGSAWAQVRLNGIEAMPSGSAALATLPDGSLLVTNIGAGGSDGLELRCNSLYGCSLGVDMSSLLASSPLPGARELRVRHKGWDGTIKGTLRVAGRPGGGVLDLECDFAPVGTTSVRVTLRDAAGDAIHTSVVTGASLSLSMENVTFPPGSPGAVFMAISSKGAPSSVSAKPKVKPKPTRMEIYLPGATCDVSGLGATQSAARLIEIEPHACAACDLQFGVESALLTVTGLPQCVVTAARLRSFDASSSAVGSAEVDEQCGSVADCDHVRRVHVSNLGPSPDNGVAVEFDGAHAAAGSGAGGTGSGGGGGEVVLGRGHELTGHVTLMKAYDDGGSETGRVIRYHDPFQNRQWLEYLGLESGATEVTVRLRSADGLEIASHTLPGGYYPVRIMSGSPAGEVERWRCVYGQCSVRFASNATIQLGSGTVHAAVREVVFSPSGGTSQSRCRSVQILANSATGSLDVHHIVEAQVRMHASGVEHAALGQATLEFQQADGSLVVRRPVCCIGSSGQDGAGIRCNSARGGGVSMDVSPLLEATGGSPQITARFRNREDVIRGQVRVARAPGVPGAIDVTFDFTGTGTTGLEWAAIREGGRTVGAGQVTEIIFRCAPSGGGGTPPPPGEPVYWRAIGTRGSGIKFVEEIDFGGEVWTVTGLGPVPLTDVVGLEVRPIECVGCTPWTSLGSIEVAPVGMESVRVRDASLLTFGPEVIGVGLAHLMEWSDEGFGAPPKIAATNLDFRGGDGMRVRLRSAISSGSQGNNVNGGSAAAPCYCGTGHVTLMKLYDEHEEEVMRFASSTSGGDPSAHTVTFDASASGATSVTWTLRSASGAALLSGQFGNGSGGDISYVGPCDASVARRMEFDSGGVTLELCENPVTAIVQGMPVANVRSVSFVPAGGSAGASPVHSFVLTGDATGKLLLEDVAAFEVPPPCAADFDGNGVREVPDIFAFLSAWFAQNPRADFDRNGTIAVPDIFAFLSAWFAGC